MNSTLIVIFLISVGFSEQGPSGDKFTTWPNQGRGSQKFIQAILAMGSANLYADEIIFC